MKIDTFVSASKARAIMDHLINEPLHVYAKTMNIHPDGILPIFLIYYSGNDFYISELVNILEEEYKYKTAKVKNPTLIRHVIMYTPGCDIKFVSEEFMKTIKN